MISLDKLIPESERTEKNEINRLAQYHERQSLLSRYRGLLSYLRKNNIPFRREEGVIILEPPEGLEDDGLTYQQYSLRQTRALNDSQAKLRHEQAKIALEARKTPSRASFTVRRFQKN